MRLRSVVVVVALRYMLFLYSLADVYPANSREEEEAEEGTWLGWDNQQTRTWYNALAEGSIDASIDPEVQDLLQFCTNILPIYTFSTNMYPFYSCCYLFCLYCEKEPPTGSFISMNWPHTFSHPSHGPYHVLHLRLYHYPHPHILQIRKIETCRIYTHFLYIFFYNRSFLIEN